MMKKLMERFRMIRENQKKNGTKGFSMIELIIVIAIMAILVALIGTQLIPYLEKSRESKDRTTLDSALTALQTALIDIEAKDVKGKTWTFGDLDSTTSGVEAAFKKFAGFGSGDLAGMLKSEAANANGNNGKVVVKSDADGLLTLTCGTIEITPKGSSSGTAATTAPGGA